MDLEPTDVEEGGLPCHRVWQEGTIIRRCRRCVHIVFTATQGRGGGHSIISSKRKAVPPCFFVVRVRTIRKRFGSDGIAFLDEDFDTPLNLVQLG